MKYAKFVFHLVALISCAPSTSEPRALPRLGSAYKSSTNEVIRVPDQQLVNALGEIQGSCGTQCSSLPLGNNRMGGSGRGQARGRGGRRP
ncbi:hypothetical protein DSO57_1029702 [Entomophthora muscae]|uniref:Uncharacterized protein n=1 Tax=Entomophthora muscae TaxID=34485 RepID=A0ACC2S315_9FUNG|nr:hypothetical protein DSO57_1029702 [Entomophthora muscae]